MNRERNPALAQGRCEIIDVDGQPVTIRREGDGPISPESRRALEEIVRAARALMADPRDDETRETFAAHLLTSRPVIRGRVRRHG